MPCSSGTGCSVPGSGGAAQRASSRVLLTNSLKYRLLKAIGFATTDDFGGPVYSMPRMNSPVQESFRKFRRVVEGYSSNCRMAEHIRRQFISMIPILQQDEGEPMNVMMFMRDGFCMPFCNRMDSLKNSSSVEEFVDTMKQLHGILLNRGDKRDSLGRKIPTRFELYSKMVLSQAARYAVALMQLKGVRAALEVVGGTSSESFVKSEPAVFADSNCPGFFLSHIRVGYRRIAPNGWTDFN